MRVLLYAECGPGVGTGHVMRCIALAQSLYFRGDDVLIASEDGSANELADREGLPFRTVSRNHIDSMLAADAFDAAVIDSYRMSSEMLAKLNRMIPIVYFDDLQQDVFDVSLLVNGNITAKLERYDRIYRGESTRVLPAGQIRMQLLYSYLRRFLLVARWGTQPFTFS